MKYIIVSLILLFMSVSLLGLFADADAIVPKKCAEQYRECILFLATNVVQGAMGCVASKPPEDEENYDECMKAGVKAFLNIEPSCADLVEICTKRELQ